VPAVGACWNSYGVAQYRECDWKGAVESLTKSITLSKTGDSNDFFFLAMDPGSSGKKKRRGNGMTRRSNGWRRINPRIRVVRFGRKAEELLGLNKK